LHAFGRDWFLREEAQQMVWKSDDMKRGSLNYLVSSRKHLGFPKVFGESIDKYLHDFLSKAQHMTGIAGGKESICGLWLQLLNNTVRWVNIKRKG